MKTDESNCSNYTTSFAVSLATASVVNGLLVVAKEKSPGLMAGMKKITGHHWTTHSAIVVVVFLVFGWFFARINGGRGPNLSANSVIRILAGGTVVGGLIIVGFYLLAD